MRKFRIIISWMVTIVVVITATVALVCPAATSKISMVDSRATLCAGDDSAHDVGMGDIPCAALHSSTLNRLVAVVPGDLDMTLLLAVALVASFVGFKQLAPHLLAAFERWRRVIRLHPILKFLSTQKLLRWFVNAGLSSSVALTV